jgi:uncharacterized protein DUF1996/beta-propeller repeat-containing protein
MRIVRRALGLLLPLALLAPSPADGASGIGQFVLRCGYTHTLADDPIVFPNQPGASHLHDFFGNTTVNAFSTVNSLLRGDTTCRVPSDTAGYWAPTTYLNGKQLRPKAMRIYYFGDPNGQVGTIPPGLQMIGGNKEATSPAENPHVHWYCGQIKGERTPLMDTPYDCRPWRAFHFVDGVIAVIEMPSCWNGVGLTPEDVAYPVGGQCPGGFPHAIPRLSQRVHLGIMNPLNPDGTVAVRLSSGPYYTLHSDFWNTWQQERLDQLVQECLAAGVHCGSIDETRSVDWTSQFGTQRYDLAYATAAADNGVYVAGFTNYALPGQTYRNRYDAFVRMYDDGGTKLWTRQFGTPGTDQVLAVAVDDTGVYVVGSTDGRFPKQARRGGLDAFVAKFASSGRPMWLTQFGTRGMDEATAVGVAGTGLFVAGSTDGRIGRTRVGGTDAFVGGFSLDGEPRWIRQFGSTSMDEAHGMAVGPGRVWVVGSTAGAFPGKSSLGGIDAFVRTYNIGGKQGWARQFGSTGTDDATSVSVTPGASYVAGFTDGALPEQTSSGETDAFVIRLTGRGDRVWMRQFGTAGSDDGVAVSARAGAVYVAGSTTAALPDQELVGETDGFVRRYEPKGMELWTLQFGTPDFDKVYGLAVNSRAAYVTGTTHGAFEGQLNAGDRDVFLTRVAFS